MQDQAAFFRGALAQTRAAGSAHGTLERTVDVAGVHLRLVFASNRLADEFLPAFGHLIVDRAGTPDATIHIWESAATGVAMVPPPCDQTQFTDRGDIWGFGEGRYLAAFQWVENSLSLYDRETRVGIWWVRSADALPSWTKAAPMRGLVQWVMEQYDRQLLHGAAVGTPEEAVLIVGQGGAGKSTTALSALSHGFTYLGDDYVVVGLDPEPAVYSLYATAKLDPVQLAAFSDMRDLAVREEALADEKAVLHLHPKRAEQLARSAPLKAVLTPSFGDGAKTAFRRTTPESLWRAAAFTTLAQLPYTGDHTKRFVHRLVDRVPGVQMVLGSDRKMVVESIGDLLSLPDPAAFVDDLPVETAPDKPRISVIIPVYNGARFLSDAVSSIIGQGYPSVEFIIVDDGSTDDIDVVVNNLPKDVTFVRQRNQGAAAARNRGLAEASGEFVAFLDVDDLWPDGSLQMLADTLVATPEAAVAHGYGQLFEQSGANGPFNPVGTPWGSFPYYIGAALFRREAFDRVGAFDRGLRFGEDTDWFHRAIDAGAVLTRVPLVTLMVRRHGGNLTEGKSLKELNTLRVLKKRLERTRSASKGERRPPVTAR